MKEILYAVNIGSVRIFCYLSFILGVECFCFPSTSKLNLTSRVGSAAAMTTFKLVFAAYFFYECFSKIVDGEVFYRPGLSHGGDQLIAEMVSNSNINIIFESENVN